MYFETVPCGLPRDPLLGAISAQSLECCQLLVAFDQLVQWKHIQHAMHEGVHEVTEYLLKRYKADAGDILDIEAELIGLSRSVYLAPDLEKQAMINTLRAYCENWHYERRSLFQKLTAYFYSFK